MTDKTFEKQFPELEGTFLGLRYSGKETFTYKEVDELIIKIHNNNNVEILKCCLSKQRVKEAIKKHTHTLVAGTSKVYVNKKELMKELGLE